MSFVYTTSIRKLRALTKRIRVVPGGTSAAKTYSIIPIEIDYAIKNPGTETSIVSESIPHLRRGAIKDFLKIMNDTGRYIDAHWNRTLLTYTFSNGSYIEFFSADQQDKVRGPRRKRLYINECNNISFETYHQLAIRTSEVIWLDFNPTHRFWAYQELENDPDAEWITLTYLDNEGLPQSIVKEIEKARDRAKESDYWRNWYNVYGLGQVGSLQGVVFSNWQLIDTVPEEAKLLGRGLDFGFTNDPTALTAVYQYNGMPVWDEEVYQKGLSNSDLSGIMKGLGITGSKMVIADSADPKSISELRSYGHYVMPAQKGPDSIAYGISLMQAEKFLVTKRSLNLINELRNYTWMKDKDGSEINKPVDAFNHAIDATRYFYLARRNQQKITVI